MRLISQAAALLRREAVLCIAAFCAVCSMPFVPPDREYLGYFDLRVLCLLFCLMAVVLGMQQCGLFAALAQRLLSGTQAGAAFAAGAGPAALLLLDAGDQ